MKYENNDIPVVYYSNGTNLLETFLILVFIDNVIFWLFLMSLTTWLECENTLICIKKDSFSCTAAPLI